MLAKDNKDVIKPYWSFVADSCFQFLTSIASLLGQTDNFGLSEDADWDHLVSPLLLTSDVDRMSMYV